MECADWVYVGPANRLQIAVKLPATDKDIEDCIEDNLGPILGEDKVHEDWMVSEAIAKVGTGLGRSV